MDSTTGQVQSAQSNFVTVLAWVFIVLSGLATLIALLQNVMIFSFMPDEAMEASLSSAKAGQDLPAMATFMTSHFRAFFAVFLALSAITLGASIALLRRKNWARLIFIFLMGLGIAWNLGGLYFQHALFSSLPSPPASEISEFQAQFDSMAQTMMFFTSIIAIGFSVLFGWIIIRLSSRKVREEFKVSP